MTNQPYAARPIRKEVHLTRFILVYVPGVHTQYFRPYEVNLTYDLVNRVQEASDQGNTLSPQMLKRTAGDIVTPSSIASGAYELEHGSGEARFSFFMELTTISHIGKTREIVSGYTDRADYVINEFDEVLLSPETKFFVTSRNVVAMGAGLGVTRHDDRIINRVDRAITPEATTMRPMDLASLQTVDHVIKGYDDISARDEGVAGVRRVIASNANLNARPLPTKASDLLPTHYVDRVCQAYRMSTEDVFDAVGADALMGETHHSAAKGYLTQDAISTMEFVNQLKLGTTATQNEFTYAALSHYMPHSPADILAAIPRDTGSFRRRVLETTTPWDGGDLNTITGYSIGYMLPTVMTDKHILSAEFTMTNETPDGRVSYTWLSVRGFFDGMVDDAHIRRFQEQITEEIYMGLLFHRVGTFSIHVNASLLDGTSLRIGLNGGPQEPFFSPTYAACNYSPLVAMTRNQASNMAYGLAHLTQHLLPWQDHIEGGALGGFDNSPIILPASHTHTPPPVLRESVQRPHALPTPRPNSTSLHPHPPQPRLRSSLR